jgi:polygalacturonase
MEGGDEGIDFKEGVRDSRIYGNEIYDLSDKAIYIDGGSADKSAQRLANDEPFVRNISIYSNHMYDLPSAGISITTEGKGDVDDIYVFNNVVHDVDGDGFIVYAHPGGASAGGMVRNVQFVNNTAFNTGLRHSGHGGFRVNHGSAVGIVFRNNIAWGNNGYDIRGEAETTIDHNLCREADRCETTTDPAFVDAAGANFSLRPASPAIDMGSSVLAPSTDRSGRGRPLGAAPDLGAHEAG